MKKMNVIVTGATGMVGEGVMHVCLNDDRIDSVLALTRQPLGISHPKLKEIIHSNFYNLTGIEDQLTGYDACFFCLGVSSVGLKESEYFKLTHSLTLHVAGTLVRQNPGMTFCYVSGAGTDSTERGRTMWARVKGKTENDLMKQPFRQVFAFRPGFIKPIPGLKHAHKFYKYVLWMFPIGRAIAPNWFCTLEEVGNAMINVTLKGYVSPVIEGTDIVVLGQAEPQMELAAVEQ